MSNFQKAPSPPAWCGGPAVPPKRKVQGKDAVIEFIEVCRGMLWHYFQTWMIQKNTTVDCITCRLKHVLFPEIGGWLFTSKKKKKKHFSWPKSNYNITVFKLLTKLKIIMKNHRHLPVQQSQPTWNQEVSKKKKTKRKTRWCLASKHRIPV